MGLSRLVILITLLATCPPRAAAQQPSPTTAGSSRPFEILDNSFLVEEAFNQERGIVQNIAGVTRSGSGEWAASFTQEWPAPGVRHQLSYTLVFDDVRSAGGLGSVALNYRYQLRTAEDGGVALAPRASLLVSRGRGLSADTGRVGMEFNLPASLQLGDVFLHGNAGFRVYPSVSSTLAATPPGFERPASDVSLVSPFVAGSAIVRVRPMLHLMLESVLVSAAQVVGPATTTREATLIVSPGLRFGWNVGAQQLVFGAAVPIDRTAGDTGTSVLGYASWELPFRH